MGREREWPSSEVPTNCPPSRGHMALSPRGPVLEPARWYRIQLPRWTKPQRSQTHRKPWPVFSPNDCRPVSRRGERHIERRVKRDLFQSRLHPSMGICHRTSTRRIRRIWRRPSHGAEHDGRVRRVQTVQTVQTVRTVRRSRPAPWRVGGVVHRGRGEEIMSCH